MKIRQLNNYIHSVGLVSLKRCLCNVDEGVSNVRAQKQLFLLFFLLLLSTISMTLLLISSTGWAKSHYTLTGVTWVYLKALCTHFHTQRQFLQSRTWRQVIPTWRRCEGPCWWWPWPWGCEAAVRPAVPPHHQLGWIKIFPTQKKSSVVFLY